MAGIKTLIDELEKQKTIITEMSGTVVQAGKHPAPAEITAGIKTIPSTDLSVATATEEDVMMGKTFYSGSPFLKTGTCTVNPTITQALFNPPTDTVIYEDKIYYSFPSNLDKVRKYLFQNNCHTVDITFDNSITQIEEYAFQNTTNFTFNNFDELTNLVFIGVSAFEKSSVAGMNVAQLPNSVVNIRNYAFQDVPIQNATFRFPDSLTSMGNYVYSQTNRTLANGVDYSNYKMQQTQGYTFFNIAFSSGVVIPPSVINIGAQYNYNGCFDTITIHSGVQYIYSRAFGSNPVSPISNFYCQWVQFEGETPPYIDSTVFAVQNLEHDFKIYVPDTAVEEYKAVANLAKYVDVICPASQKE